MSSCSNFLINTLYQESMSENARLERRLIALEEDVVLEKREHERTKGALAGTIQKSHADKDALREKLR